jgi:hypothetical protein
MEALLVPLVVALGAVLLAEPDRRRHQRARAERDTQQ